MPMTDFQYPNTPHTHWVSTKLPSWQDVCLCAGGHIRDAMSVDDFTCLTMVGINALPICTESTDKSNRLIRTVYTAADLRKMKAAQKQP